MAEQIIKFPFGPATVVALSATGAQAITVENMLTVVDGVTVSATDNRTLNLMIDDNLEVGARLLIKFKTDATETLIFGTGITGVTIDGVADKTNVVEAVFDGTVFVVSATYVQID
jgi:hypothetical protein